MFLQKILPTPRGKPGKLLFFVDIFPRSAMDISATEHFECSILQRQFWRKEFKNGIGHLANCQKQVLLVAGSRQVRQVSPGARLLRVVVPDVRVHRGGGQSRLGEGDRENLLVLSVSGKDFVSMRFCKYKISSKMTHFTLICYKFRWVLLVVYDEKIVLKLWPSRINLLTFLTN